VPLRHLFFAFIEALAKSEIMAGCVDFNTAPTP